jgi:N-methylhydantoinase B
MKPAMTAHVDPITTEIIRNGLLAATEEMKTNLMRTAYNMIIYEALDFTVGLLDARGDTVSIGLGLPMFIRGMSDTVKAKLEKFGGAAGLAPGDVLLTNDAYLTGSHLNHMTFSVPIFWQGELVAFSSCMAHWQDVGGAAGGMTTDIYAEGLQMPIVKYYRAGVLNEDVLEIIRMNVRIPERALGDLRAQIAAVKTGEKRFVELIEKYGRDAVLGAIADIMDQSERAARASVRAIPDGTYEAESFMDDDGVSVGERVPLRVKVVVAGDRMTVDLSGLADQVRGFYNSSGTTGRACAQVAFKCLTAAQDYPINDGCFRGLDVILPPGKVVSAVKPAPMRWWMTYPMTIVDTIFKAMAPAIPDKVIAGHHADLVITKISGRQPRDGQLYLYTGGLIGGGWGAKREEDGVSGTIAINDGDTHNSPTEQLEAKFPLLVEAYRLRDDSGGPGRHRGGLGVEQIVHVLHEIAFNSQIERVESRPWGLFGGLSGYGNQVAIRKAGEADEVAFPSGKVLSRHLKAGDRYALRSGGGGGFGSPLERPLEAVAHDVRQGYVSRKAARQYYGVVFDVKTGAVLAEPSGKLRELMRRARLPLDQPLTSRGEVPLAEAVLPDGADPEAVALLKEAEAAGLYIPRCCA